MVETFTAPYSQKYKNYDVLRFWKDGSMLLGASDLTGRLWSGLMRRFEVADDAVMNRDSLPAITNCTIGDEDTDVRTPTSLVTSALLESTVSDAIAFPLSDDATGQQHKAVLAYDSGDIEVLELVADETGQSEPIFVNATHMNEHDDAVSSLGLTCDHKKVISGSYDQSIKIWSTESWSTVGTYLFAHSNHVLMVSCHLEVPDIFASCSQDGRVLLWDTRQPRPANVIQKSSGVVPSALAWQPFTQGTKLVVGTEIGEVMLKDVRKVDVNLNQLKKQNECITRIEFDSWSTNKLAVCANETKFVVLHLEEDIFSIIYQDDSHDDFVRGVAWNPGTRKLYTCAWDGRVLRHEDNPQSKIQC